MAESLYGQFQPIGWSLETDTSQMSGCAASNMSMNLFYKARAEQFNK